MHDLVRGDGIATTMVACRSDLIVNMENEKTLNRTKSEQDSVAI